MSEPIFLQNVRVSFPHLKTPHAAKPTATPKYQVDLILAQDHPGWAQIMQRVQEVATQKYGEHAQQMLNMINQDRMKRCYGAGTEKINKKTMQPYTGYENAMYVAVKNSNRPQIFKADGSVADPANDMEYMAEAGKIYGGCYVNAAIDLYTSKGNDGVFGGLLGIQFVKDGESFGDAAPDVTSMFGATGATPSTTPSPAGAPAPAQPATPFGQPSQTPNPGMPAAPFAPPGMPGFMGGDD